MPRSIAWDDLQFFLAVRDRGTVGAAAKWLGVNHTTVLRHIGTLEEALGQRLFDRLHSGYTLTTEGHELAASLAGVSEQIDSLQRRFGVGDPEVRGAVRLTTTDTLARGVLMPHLATFQQRFPLVELQIVVSNSFLNLTQREADIAIRGSNRPPENLIGRHIGTMQTALYASRAYLERVGKQASVDKYTWVAPDETLASLDSAKWISAHVAAESIAMRCDSLVALADAVSAGIGVGLVSCPLGEHRPELVRLDEPIRELDTQIWLLTHPDLKQMRRIRVLIDHMVEQLRADPRLVPG